MLEGKNIVLRSLRDSDLEFLEKIENNKENWQFGSEKKQYSREELVAYIANAKVDIALTKQYRFVIDFRGALIGFIDLFDGSLVILLLHGLILMILGLLMKQRGSLFLLFR